ncbi:MAG: hypothetical protein M9894_09255 [Planctomycetes bacterium]|nr:hypothetical protein [Planctomycetota bacterium]
MTARRATSRRAPAQKPGASPPPTAPGVGALLLQALRAGGALALSAARQAAASPDVRRLALLGALGAGVAGASEAARARVEAWPRFQVDRAALQLTPLPDALSPRARRDLERLPLPPRPNAFDPQLVPFTAACLAGLPWVKEVEAVRLDAKGRLSFALLAREPVARIASRGGDEVLTADGALVPLAYAARPDDLPAVLGAPASGEGRLRALAAANALLRELGALRPHVKALDLSNLDGARDPRESEVVLHLVQGPRVDWGRPPGPGDDAEPRTIRAGLPRLDGAAKLAALRRFLEGGPDLATVERVSVRWDEVTYVLKAPLAGSVPAMRDALARGGR